MLRTMPSSGYRLCIYCRTLERLNEPCPLLQERSQIVDSASAASGLSPQDARQINALQEQTSSLCSRCSSYNILDLFMNFQPLDEVQRQPGARYYEDFEQARLPLGRPSSLLLTPSCQFCRILYCILPRSLQPGLYDGGGAKSARVLRTDEPDIYIEPYRAYLRKTGWGDFPEELKNRCAILLGFATSAASNLLEVDYGPVTSGSPLIRAPRMTGPAIALESRFAALDRSAYSLRPLRNTLDLSILRHGLDYCLQNHANCCQAEKPVELLTIQMIDVVERTVIPCPRDCDYVALSYVWGGVQPCPGALENMYLPQTIEDAIVVTKALSRRYLWVDALCIDQSPNPTPSQLQDKIKQLDMMSTIYGCATVTIIALAGKHANAGLAGISAPRLTQVRETIDGCTLFTTSQHISMEMQAAVWSSRAWTLQEDLLSRRSLIFTESQVVFRCLDTEIEEEADVATHPNQPTECHAALSTFYKFYTPSPTHQPTIPTRPKRHLYIFSNMLSTYTSRRMTNASDSLNAFRGVLTALQTQLFPQGFVHGLPLRSHAYSLAWMHARDATPKRRAQFPSWSWTGWEGRVVYPEKLLDSADGHATATTDLEVRFAAACEGWVEVEGWVVGLEVRTEPLSEVWVGGQAESIGTVREGEARHNNTLKTGRYTCLVMRRLCESIAGREAPRETVFLLALERVDGQIRRRAVLTVTFFAGQGFDQVGREKRVVQLT